MLWGLVLFWAVGATGAYGYAQYRDIPTEMVLGLLPAFLLEATLFLGFGLERERTRLERLKPWTLALAGGGLGLVAFSAAGGTTTSWSVNQSPTPFVVIGAAVGYGGGLFAKRFGSHWRSIYP